MMLNGASRRDCLRAGRLRCPHTAPAGGSTVRQPCSVSCQAAPKDGQSQRSKSTRKATKADVRRINEVFGGDRQVPGFGRFGAGSSATPAGTSWRDIRRFFNDSAHRITNLHVYAMLAALATVLANVVVPADERREVQRLAEDILRAATRIIDTFQPNEVNEVLALVGQMGGRPPAWFLAAAAQRSTDAARQQAAAAAAGVVPAAGFEADAAQAAHVDEVLSLTAHLLTNDFTPAFEWQRSLVALSHPRLASLSPVQLAILAKACTTWSLDPFVQWWRSFLDSCQGSFELMSLEELLLVARAAAMASSTPAQPSAEWCLQLCAAAAPQVGAASAHLAVDLWSAVSAIDDYSPDATWQAAVVRVAAASEVPLPPSIAAHLLHHVAKAATAVGRGSSSGSSSDDGSAGGASGSGGGDGGGGGSSSSAAGGIGVQQLPFGLARADVDRIAAWAVAPSDLTAIGADGTGRTLQRFVEGPGGLGAVDCGLTAFHPQWILATLVNLWRLGALPSDDDVYRSWLRAVSRHVDQLEPWELPHALEVLALLGRPLSSADVDTILSALIEAADDVPLAALWRLVLGGDGKPRAAAAGSGSSSSGGSGSGSGGPPAALPLLAQRLGYSPAPHVREGFKRLLAARCDQLPVSDVPQLVVSLQRAGMTPVDSAWLAPLWSRVLAAHDAQQEAADSAAAAAVGAPQNPSGAGGGGGAPPSPSSSSSSLAADAAVQLVMACRVSGVAPDTELLRRIVDRALGVPPASAPPAVAGTAAAAAAADAAAAAAAAAESPLPAPKHVLQPEAIAKLCYGLVAMRYTPTPSQLAHLGSQLDGACRQAAAPSSSSSSSSSSGSGGNGFGGIGSVTVSATVAVEVMRALEVWRVRSLPPHVLSALAAALPAVWLDAGGDTAIAGLAFVEACGQPPPAAVHSRLLKLLAATGQLLPGSRPVPALSCRYLTLLMRSLSQARYELAAEEAQLLSSTTGALIPVAAAEQHLGLMLYAYATLGLELPAAAVASAAQHALQHLGRCSSGTLTNCAIGLQAVGFAADADWAARFEEAAAPRAADFDAASATQLLLALSRMGIRPSDAFVQSLLHAVSATKELERPQPPQAATAATAATTAAASLGSSSSSSSTRDSAGGSAQLLQSPTSPSAAPAGDSPASGAMAAATAAAAAPPQPSAELAQFLAVLCDLGYMAPERWLDSMLSLIGTADTAGVANAAALSDPAASAAAAGLSPSAGDVGVDSDAADAAAQAAAQAEDLNDEEIEEVQRLIAAAAAAAACSDVSQAPSGSSSQ